MTKEEIDLANKKTGGPTNNNVTAPNVSQSGRQLPVMTNASVDDTNYVEDIPEQKTTSYDVIKQTPWGREAYAKEHGLTVDTSPSATQQNTGQDNKQSWQPVEDMDGMMKSMKPEETPEQKKKREKRERMGKIFAAIGDGVSALSNLWFATKGAPSSYNPDNSILKRTQAREDFLRKENFANDMNLLNSKIRLKELSERLKRQEAQDKYNQDRLNFYNKQEERRQKELDYKQFKAENDASFKDATIELKREYNEIQRDLADGRITLMQAQARLADARARHEGVKTNKENQGITKEYEYETDEMGNKKVKSVTTRPAGGGGGGEKTEKGNSKGRGY